jgi:hypothetical protein
MTAAAKTRETIVARIDEITPDIQVRDFEIRNIETVMEEVESEAHRLHPGGDDDARWARIQFYKDELLARFAASLRPRLSAVYHQYIASTLRGAQGGRVYSVDESGCVDMFVVT